jgi:winged helix-turn helix protein
MTVIQMSGQELTRLRIMIDLADNRITIEAAAALMGLGRRQVFRLRRAFSADGAPALISGKRGRPSNRRHGETFRRTVLALVRQHYPDFGPTFAAEKLASCQRLHLGVETLRQWMIADGLWVDRRHRLASPPRTSRADGVSAWVNWCRSTARNTRGLRIAATRARCWHSWMTRPAG